MAGERKAKSNNSESEENKVAIEHDVTNEQVVVAAVLVDKAIRERYVPKEPADIFIDSDHALIWSAAKRILQRKQVFDLQTLHKEVAGKVRLQYLKQLMGTYPSPPANMRQHVSALYWDSARARATQDAIPQFLRLLKDNTAPESKVKQAAERISRSLVVRSDTTFMMDPRNLARRQRVEIEKRQTIACYEYGIPALDYFTDGTHRCIPGAAPGKITNITAVSGAGKSVLAAYIALQQARAGRTVLFGAWEMGPGDTLEAMANISFHGRPAGAGATSLGSRYATSTGKLNESELDTLEERMVKIGQFVRFFDPPFADDPDRVYSNEDSLAELHRMVVDSGCEVIVYDLFERCLPDGAPGPERRALFGLQNLHKVTDTHGIMCTQQKLKEVEKRADKRPARDTILGSQAWVDISDTIIGVHRPALWKAIADDTMELLILKQRFGKWPLAVQHTWDGDRMTLTNGIDVDFEHTGGMQGAPM